MNWIRVILCTIVVLSITLLILLFGDLPSYRGTLLHRARLLVVDDIFHAKIEPLSIHIDNRFFGGKLERLIFSSGLRSAVGWSVPLLFLSIFITAVDFFFKFTYPVVSVQYSKQYQWFQRYIIVIPSISVNLLSFALSVFINPGSVTRLMASPRINKLKLMDTFPYDNLIFFDPERESHRTECYTCHIPKLARSKHCSTCNDCFLLMDHHCIWVNNCIGYYNYRFFLSFLVSILWIFTYGGYLCYMALRISLDDYKTHITNNNRAGYNADLLNMIAKSTETESWISKTKLQIYWRLITKTNINNETSGIIFILCLALFPMVLGFLLEHLRLIYLGVTTNETVKWGYIHELVKSGLLYRYEPYERSLSSFAAVPLYLTYEKSNDGSSRFFKLSDESLFSVAGEEAGKVVRVNSWEDLDNVYDHGFWGNLKAHLLPLDFHK